MERVEFVWFGCSGNRTKQWVSVYGKSESDFVGQSEERKDAPLLEDKKALFGIDQLERVKFELTNQSATGNSCSLVDWRNTVL